MINRIGLLLVLMVAGSTVAAQEPDPESHPTVSPAISRRAEGAAAELGTNRSPEAQKAPEVAEAQPGAPASQEEPVKPGPPTSEGTPAPTEDPQKPDEGPPTIEEKKPAAPHREVAPNGPSSETTAPALGSTETATPAAPETGLSPGAETPDRPAATPSNEIKSRAGQDAGAQSRGPERATVPAVNRAASASSGKEAVPAKTAPAPVRPQPPLPRFLQRSAAWRNTFDRVPLGFDRGTPGRAWHDLEETTRRITRSPEALLALGAAAGWGFWTGLGALALLLLGGLVLERVSPAGSNRRWRRLQARARGSRLAQVLIQIVRAALTPLTGFLLWTLGGLLADTVSEPFAVVQGWLGIWLTYRVVDSVQRQLICKPRDPERAALAAGLHRLLRFAAVWGAGWLAFSALHYREDVVALWASIGHLCLVLGAFALVAPRDRLFRLLPDADSHAYRRFIRAFRAAYLPLVYASLVISLLWVAGYQNLAAVFLGRGWAVVGLLLVLVLAYQAVKNVLARWIPEDTAAVAARAEALAASYRLLALFGFMLALGLSLRLLGLRDPFLHLLSLEWFRVGAVRISGFSLWTGGLILLFAGFFSRWLQAMLNFRVFTRVGIEAGEAYALNRLLHYALLMGAGLLVLNNLGLSPQNLALVAGGLSVGIGFGLQDIARNIASGLILLTSRQVRQGDIISVSGEMGKVREVNLRSTLVTTFDNVDLLIPNSKLLDDTLTNWTHSSTLVRIKVPFGVAYSADPASVAELATEVARAHPEVLNEPAPDVWFLEMGDNSLQFELVVWIDQARSVRPRVKTGLLGALLAALRERDIEVPFPQRDLHLRTGIPWEELLAALSGPAAPSQNGNSGLPPAPHSTVPGGLKANGSRTHVSEPVRVTSAKG